MFHFKLSLSFLLFILISVGCKKKQSEAVVDSNCKLDVNVSKVLSQYEEMKGPIARINFAQNLKPTWAQHDLHFLRAILEESNTGLYRYHSKQEIDSLFNAKMCLFQSPLDYLDFVREISEVFSYIACGHSGWSHTPSFYKFRKDSMLFFS
jgi:hypothetical protein